jgi:CubicO group peptidase (beta-lactamase class C family)
MTAVALFREHEAGRLDLDAPVHRYLPWLPLATPATAATPTAAPPDSAQAEPQRWVAGRAEAELDL